MFNGRRHEFLLATHVSELDVTFVPLSVSEVAERLEYQLDLGTGQETISDSLNPKP